MQNGVYHRNGNVNTPYRGVNESRQPWNSDSGVQWGNSGNAQDAIRKARVVANAPRAMQGCSNEHLNVLCDSEPGISNILVTCDYSL